MQSTAKEAGLPRVDELDVWPLLSGRRRERKWRSYTHIAGDRSQVATPAQHTKAFRNRLHQADDAVRLSNNRGSVLREQGHRRGADRPIVFQKSYTSQVMDGRHGSRASRLQLIRAAIEGVSATRRPGSSLIDGVGYVSVGSVSNIENADVAALMNAFVVLVASTRPTCSSATSTRAFQRQTAQRVCAVPHRERERQCRDTGPA